MKNVNKAFRKKDAMQLVTGKPVYPVSRNCFLGATSGEAR